MSTITDVSYYNSLLFVFVLVTLLSVSAAETCTTGVSHSGARHHFASCYYGCCGDKPYEFCCPYSSDIIVGSCLAVLYFVGICIALICCCLKMRFHHEAELATHGRIIRTYLPAGSTDSPEMGAQTVAPHQPSAYGQPVKAQTAAPHQPSAYGQPVRAQTAAPYQPSAYGQPAGALTAAPYQPFTNGQPAGALTTAPLQPTVSNSGQERRPYFDYQSQPADEHFSTADDVILI